MKGVLPLQSVENHPRRCIAPSCAHCPSAGAFTVDKLCTHTKLAMYTSCCRQKRLNAGGAKTGSGAATRPAAQQLTLSLPDAGSRADGPGLGLAPPKPAARSGVTAPPDIRV